MTRVTVYVDGFNFYYGLRTQKTIDRKWQKSYWIDLVKLFEHFLGEDQRLEKVIYFTASPLSHEKSIRQSAFLNANKLINGDRFEIVRGNIWKKLSNVQIVITQLSSQKKRKLTLTFLLEWLLIAFKIKQIQSFLLAEIVI